MVTSPHPTPHPWRSLLAIGIGAAAGFALGALIYVVLAPWLEDQSGWLRELQGMAWNLVPLLTVVGAAVGGVVSATRR